MTQVQRFNSQTSFGDFNNFSLEAGKSYSALNQPRKYIQKNQKNQKNQNNQKNSAFWDNLNFSRTSKPF